jgi:hypothetical protein
MNAELIWFVMRSSGVNARTPSSMRIGLAVLAVASVILAAAVHTTSSSAQDTPNGAPLSLSISCNQLPPKVVCVSVVLPQSSNGVYEASVDFDGTIVTSDQVVDASVGLPTSISAIQDPGYGFSFWSSLTGVTFANFESSATTVTVSAASTLYLNDYTTSEATDIVFDVAYSNVASKVSSAQIELEHHGFTDGQSAELNSGQAYSISPQSFASGYSFSQWASTVGTVGSLTTESTTFTPSSSGALALVVSAISKNWGGYVWTAPSITTASGTIQLPSSFSTQSGGVDQIGFWVGIGGSLEATNPNLWQAGVIVSWGDSTVVINPFWEMVGTSCPASETQCQAQIDTKYTAHPGDSIYVYLSSYEGVSSFMVQDQSSNNFWTYTGTQSFTSDGQSAEWIAENASESTGVGWSHGIYPFEPVGYSQPYIDSSPVAFAGPAVAYFAHVLSGKGTFDFDPTDVSPPGYAQFEVEYS